MIVMPQLTPEDRAFLTEHLSRTRDLLLSEISSVSGRTSGRSGRMRKPGPSANAPTIS